MKRDVNIYVDKFSMVLNVILCSLLFFSMKCCQVAEQNLSEYKELKETK
jgi:hypothetical protein